jgi:toxin-antitoxin system PIN domain toxin
VIVPDVNLLVYAVHEESPVHARAARWLRALLDGDEPVGIPWMISIAFLRLVTNRRIFPNPFLVDDALAVVDGWYARRFVSAVEPGQEHWSILKRLLLTSGAAGNLTSDAHLAAICIERGAILHTADADFGRFPGLQWTNPLAD